MEAAYPLIAFEEDEMIVHKNWGKIVKKKKTSSTERKATKVKLEGKYHEMNKYFQNFFRSF